ncbi:Tetraspanin [Teratosphaeria destructans]|uniref:Tetraspanin n=1 Tax=Teratosphaeria destructans TaxID=418781 RepID=A0A9W7VZF7_9PEZI|nr:Tetraspanin [Teratosphaeria destructans]
MALTRRQIVTAISVVVGDQATTVLSRTANNTPQYLLALTIIGAYALHTAHVYSLPIPDILCALTVALPPLAGVALETILSSHAHLATKGQLQTSRIFQIVVVFFVTYEAVLATLAGTHLSPSGSLNCALRERWQGMFRAKNGEGLRVIQDAFRCCGLGSVRDMAFPFPSASEGRGADACVVAYHRERACLDPWRGQERQVAIMLLIVPVAVFAWKVCSTPPIGHDDALLILHTLVKCVILLAPSSSSAWLPSAIYLPADEDASGSGSRPKRPAAIAYRDLEDDDANVDSNDSLHQEIRRLNTDSDLASQVETGRGAYRDHRNWREEARVEN